MVGCVWGGGVNVVVCVQGHGWDLRCILYVYRREKGADTVIGFYLLIRHIYIINIIPIKKTIQKQV